MPEDTQQPNIQPDVSLPSEPVAQSTDFLASADVQPAIATAETEPLVDDGNTEEPAFRWQASEYVHNHKDPSWYVGLVCGLVLLISAVAWLHFWVVAGAFVAMGVAIAVYAHRPPRVLTYELTSNGIVIEGRTFPFMEFRSFGVLPETDWHTIDLEPTKRFRPRMAVLFDPQDLDAIVNHLELYLPRMDRQPDLIERATQYLRF